MDGVDRSLAEAAAKPHAKPWYRTIYAGEEPVGFLRLPVAPDHGRPAV